MAEPFCQKLRKLLGETADELNITNHKKGTVVTIEGPRFSTKAESKMFQSWGGEVINMSTVPEAVLAREAGICYAVIAMSTDYDCWRDGEESVTIDLVLETMKKNAENVKKIFLAVIPRIDWVECECGEAIKTAILWITNFSRIGRELYHEFLHEYELSNLKKSKKGQLIFSY